MNEVTQFFRDIKTAWKTLWPSKVFRIQFFLSIIIFALVIHYCSLYMSIWETRKGTLLLDPLLNKMTPRNFSILIFSIVHSAVLFSLFLNLATPKQMLKAFQTFSLLLLLRTACVYLIPLERPTGMIYLQDPITALFLNNVNVVTKDLFFSGHIATMCLLIYFAPKRFWKTYLMFVTPILAGLILWQHVHYTVDIIAAPFFTFFCCKAIDILNERWEYGVDKISYSNWQYQQ